MVAASNTSANGACCPHTRQPPCVGGVRRRRPGRSKPWQCCGLDFCGCGELIHSGACSGVRSGAPPPRFARRGVLPVGCPCVSRRSCGKAMEMSHSGLVRLPAKEVGVEAPREFESPHLRKSKSPGAQRRAGASSSAQPLPQRGAVLGPTSLQPTERSTARILRSTLAVAHQSCWE